MRFGLALPQYDFSLPPRSRIDWAGVSEWGGKAEAWGFDSVWLSDHLFYDLGRYGGTSEPQAAMECFTTLAALSATTEKIRIGSLVACNDLRSPALVAKMAATLDVLSRGRIEIGMGAGWFEAEYHAAGVSFLPSRDRIERLGEAVRIVIGMLSSESFSFGGKHYQVTNASNLPAPVQSPRPPVWVGGKGDRVVSVAGRYADGFNTVWAWTPEDYGGRIAVLERAARKAGRDPASVRRSVGLHCLPGNDGAELASRWKTYLGVVPGMGQGPDLEAWRRDKLCGDAGEMLARIDAFGAHGVEEVILSFGLLPFQIADPEAVEWFAREVVPNAR